MEKVALSQYTALYEKNHHKSKVSSCGLFVSQRYPFIGATPDGVVTCSCCGKGLIEIKCSFSYQHLTPTEVATQHTYYNLYLEGNDVKLKSDTKWYTQIQTQLGVTELQWCDFVFFTRKGISIDRIGFNQEYFEKCVQSAKSFFFNFLKSKLQ
ncbi:hypothetical protein FSP39_020913 [Pinctada imbricata]|uniref:YqaJ viral recombinase domain-containing protein n=1 Tax=Pinctada imbricata TaxID=66713 RepID=A0AA88XTQ0_PINIB|nr:hypothetical protein FSP39_020913 [Pinctada imbricata]